MRLEIDIAEGAEGRRGRFEAEHRAIGQAQQRGCVTGGNIAQHACLRVDDPDEGTGQPVIIFGEQQPVAHVGDAPGIVRIKRRNANRLPHQNHQACRFDPFAGDVADRHHDFAGCVFEGVVPVAPDIGFGGAGPIVRREFDTRALGEALW